jgi:hypothetical protein
VYANVGSEFPHGILKPGPGFIDRTIKGQEFGFGRFTNLLPDCGSGSIERIFRYV